MSTKYQKLNIAGWSLGLWSDVRSTAVPKVCSVDPKGSATSCQGIRGYISVKCTAI